MQLDATGTVDYRSYYVAKETHQPAVALARCIYELAFKHPRVRNPARVRYTVDPATFLNDPATGVHLRGDGAYWVSGMVPSSPEKGSVDLTSYGLGRVPLPGASFVAPRENLSAGRDFCGLNAAVQTQDSWVERGRGVAARAARIRRHLAGTVTGLSALTVAVDRATPGRGALSLDLTVDRSVVLTLTGFRSAPVHVALHAGRNQRTVTN
jgi:hypothetical protein